ncbi:MAG: M12 family metallopeptidase [Blastocatellia bacterium]
MATSKNRKTTRKSAASSKKASSRKTATKKKTAKPMKNYSEWFRSTTKPKKGIIVLNRGVPDGVLKQVEYSAINGIAIFEGDIMLGTVDQIEATVKGFDSDELPTAGIPANQRAVEDMDVPVEEVAAAGIGISEERGVGITGDRFRWPRKQVPFEIDPNLPNAERVTKAIAHWHAKTSIRLIPRNPSSTDVRNPGHRNFVRFVDQGGCFSQVGMRGGMQVISLGPGCSVGSAIHEIGHTIGLWHEQSREDRTKFIRVLFQNIVAGMEHNFTQHISDGDDIGKYDYGSIMHYPATAFSKNGQPTIVPLKPGGGAIGQRNGLSNGDIAAAEFLYKNVQ